MEMRCVSQLENLLDEYGWKVMRGFRQTII